MRTPHKTDTKAGLLLENKHLKKMLAHADAALRRQAPRRKWKPKLVVKPSGKDDLVRVIMPDSHGMYADAGAMAAFLADTGTLNPDELVLLGDHVDCGGFLAAHHVLGYVAQMAYSYEEDIAACNGHLDALMAAAPRAKFHYLEGNHEQRVEKWCVGQALSQAKDADFLRRAFAPQYLLGLSNRGIPYYRRAERHHGLPLPGAIRLGKCHFIHEAAGGRHAAAEHVNSFAASVVFGHTHRADGIVVRKVSTGEIGAWSPGCLSQLQPLWCHTRPTTWSHGYGVQVVARSGLFQHFNVSIARGQSCATPLIRRLANAA